MILNVRVRRSILILGDGPHIVVSRKNDDDVLTRCTLKTITFLICRRNGLSFIVDVFHNPLLKYG